MKFGGKLVFTMEMKNRSGGSLSLARFGRGGRFSKWPPRDSPVKEVRKNYKSKYSKKYL